MPAFAADYQTALLALAILALIVLFQSFLAAYFGFIRGKDIPGVAPAGGHKDLGFRALRCYANGAENLPAFAVAIFVAIFAGADAGLVNMLAVAHLILRIVFAAIYYAGIGKPAGGPRSIVYILGWLVNIVIGAIAVMALL